jgi:hypothetical protein
MDEPRDDDGPLEALLSGINPLPILLADDEEERGRLLEQLAEIGEPERDIAAQLTRRRSLHDPEGFGHAHRLAMRSLEVLDRNGARRAELPRMGPLAALAGPVVQLFVRWIVRSHKNQITRDIETLYAGREVSSGPGGDEHRQLRRARRDAELVGQRFRGAQLALPGFLLGGVVLSTGFSLLADLLGPVFNSKVATLAFFVVVGAAVVGLSWCANYAAGVARRRIRLSTDGPFAQLWSAVGACGQPPRDRSYQLALWATIVTLVGWIGVPAVIWVIFS